MRIRNWLFISSIAILVFQTGSLVYIFRVKLFVETVFAKHHFVIDVHLIVDFFIRIAILLIIVFLVAFVKKVYLLDVQLGGTV